MKKYEFRQVNSNDVIPMAELLLQRQKIESINFPYLMSEKQNETFIVEILNEIYNNNRIVGLGAYFDGQLVGYLFGMIKFDTVRGRHAWVPYEGVAIKESENWELITSLYAEVSELWLQYGCYKHYAVPPVGDKRYINAFQRLSFGYEQVHGILDINKYKPFEVGSEINVRIASKSDRDVISSMSDIIFSYQNKSPIYAPVLPEMMTSIRKGYKGMVDDKDALVFLADNSFEALGFQVYYNLEAELMVPEKGIELGVAGTYNSYMGLGVGKKLMNEATTALKERGYRYISCDWRITNLSSSSFWEKCGFEEIAHRMFRQLDERLAWANFDNSLL